MPASAAPLLLSAFRFAVRLVFVLVLFAIVTRNVSAAAPTELRELLSAIEGSAGLERLSANVAESSSSVSGLCRLLELDSVAEAQLWDGLKSGRKNLVLSVLRSGLRRQSGNPALLKTVRDFFGLSGEGSSGAKPPRSILADIKDTASNANVKRDSFSTGSLLGSKKSARSAQVSDVAAVRGLLSSPALRTISDEQLLLPLTWAPSSRHEGTLTPAYEFSELERRAALLEMLRREQKYDPSAGTLPPMDVIATGGVSPWGTDRYSNNRKVSFQLVGLDLERLEEGASFLIGDVLFPIDRIEEQEDGSVRFRAYRSDLNPAYFLHFTPSLNGRPAALTLNRAVRNATGFFRVELSARNR